MKLDSASIKKFARNLFKHKQRAANVRLIKPRRDWLIGLAFGFAILVGIMAWSAYMYVTNRSGEQLQTTDTSSPLPTYRAAAVADALDYFAEKETAFRAIQSDVPLAPPVEPEPETATTTPANDIDDESATTTNPIDSNEVDVFVPAVEDSTATATES